MIFKVDSVINKLKYRQDVKEEKLESVNKLRSKMGLRIIRRGKRECLHCAKEFYSKDLCTNKTCDQCLDVMERAR